APDRLYLHRHPSHFGFLPKQNGKEKRKSYREIEGPGEGGKIKNKL
uniref:Uncharacterized protein n=1 Tax=Aegilops tauschii subsp. strangulata TaxID=200361 RepID=A0A452XXG4_AEGTS